MKTLDFISHVEEHNGIAEAVFLLEERLANGCCDKLTVMRLLFLYWFMKTEPAFLTNDNGTKDWVSHFVDLLEQSRQKFRKDSEFNWVTGYLSCLLHESDFRRSGEELLIHARQLAPFDPLPLLAWQRVKENSSGSVDLLELDRCFKDWGMMGDYFRLIFCGSHTKKNILVDP